MIITGLCPWGCEKGIFRLSKNLALKLASQIENYKLVQLVTGTVHRLPGSRRSNHVKLMASELTDFLFFSSWPRGASLESKTQG